MTVIRSLNGTWLRRVGMCEEKECAVPYSTLPVGRSFCRRTFTVENDPDKVVDVSEQESADENTSGEVSVDASDVANGESDTSDVSDSTAKESSAFEKVFQVLFIVIMTVGVLGLPFYFWLNSKKKRALNEAEESDDGLDNKEE